MEAAEAAEVAEVVEAAEAAAFAIARSLRKALRFALRLRLAALCSVVRTPASIVLLAVSSSSVPLVRLILSAPSSAPSALSSPAFFRERFLGLGLATVGMFPTGALDGS